MVDYGSKKQPTNFTIHIIMKFANTDKLSSFETPQGNPGQRTNRASPLVSPYLGFPIARRPWPEIGADIRLSIPKKLSILGRRANNAQAD